MQVGQGLRLIGSQQEAGVWVRFLLLRDTYILDSIECVSFSFVSYPSVATSSKYRACEWISFSHDENDGLENA